MASEMQKSSPSSPAQKVLVLPKMEPSTSSPARKVLALPRMVRRGESKETCSIPQKEKDTESEMSAIDKLADIAKDKIQELTLENTGLKRNLVSFTKKVLTNLRNGLCELHNSLIDVQTFTELAMGLEDAIRTKEKEAEDMISKVNFIATTVNPSTPIDIPLMNECEAYACKDILRNASASTTTIKTRLEHIKQTFDGCLGKLEKQAEGFGIPSLRKSDGKFITLAEFNEAVDKFVAKLESRLQISERQRNQQEQKLNLVMLLTAHVERIALLREFIQETIQPLVKELNETKVRVERRLLVNTLQIEEDYVSCKKAVEEKLPAKSRVEMSSGYY